MNHNLISKRTNKGIVQIPEINKIINIKPSLKYKPNSIINLYSTLTPTESANPKNKNLLISSNIKNISKNQNQNQNLNKNNQNNNNKNKNTNNISNDIIKKNNQVKNMKYKGSSSSTNIKANYSIFKTKKLKSSTSLVNNINNHLGSSIKMNLPKNNLNKNINKSKSKEKMISSFNEDITSNIFRKSMSHSKMNFPYSNEYNSENIKLDFLYLGSEPNLKQNTLNRYGKLYNNEAKKEIKKAFKRLLTVNTDFEIGPLYKAKFKSNHLTNNSNNKSKDNIQINEKNKKDIKPNNNIIKGNNSNNIKNSGNEKNMKNNVIKNNVINKKNKVINNISHINIANNINNTVRINSNSKSKSKSQTKFNLQVKKKNINKSKNNYINVNKYKNEKNKILNKNKSPKNKDEEKNENIVVLYSNNNKFKEKGMGGKSKTSNKNININININDIKTTNININNINIGNDERKKIMNNYINPFTNININSINSNMNNIINYITNINTTNLGNFLKTNNYNYNVNNQVTKINKVHNNTKSAKDIINKGLHLKNILDIQIKKNINNFNNLDIIDNYNNLIEYSKKTKEQRENCFSSDNNHKTSIFTNNNNNLSNNKNKIDLIKNNKEKILKKNMSNNIINNIVKEEDTLQQKNKKNKKVLSSSCSQKNTIISNQKIKVRRKNPPKYSNKAVNNKNDINNINKNVNKFINKCLTKFRLSSTSAKNIKDKRFRDKNNINKMYAKNYYSRLIKNEPVSPKKLIKYFYKYLKKHEIPELKKLNKKKGLVYYAGEIISRINKGEKTHIIAFNSTKNIRRKIDNEMNEIIQINHCPSCLELRPEKSKEFKKLKKGIELANPNINNKFNFNDREGDYLFKKGYHLNYRYEIIGLLGKGSFGEAVQCYDHKNKEIVCIKIINSREEFQSQAMIEIKILTSISLNDVNNDSGNIKFYHYFNFRRHICIVSELLGENLYQIIQLNNFKGLNLSLIRYYTIELLFSLMFLKRLKIIHCDLKPENILVVPSNRNKVKIIDFGSSCFQYEIMYSYIQSRFYRAPEVILELGYSYEIDMWSLGCILCELFVGIPIFPGSDEMEQINYIMKILGVPPSYFIENSQKNEFFFNEENNEYYAEFNKYSNFDIETKKRNIEKFLKSTNNIDFNKNTSSNNLLLFDYFIDFIAKCLEWNPKDRITPEEGLMHPFIINNFDKEQLYRHKLKIKRMRNNASKGIFTSREKDKDLSNSSNHNNYNSNNNPKNLKSNKISVRPPLNLSFIKNDNKLNDNIILKKEKNKNDNIEIYNLNFNSNSISDYIGKKNEKRKNHSISNYNYTHFLTNENHIYNIKNLNVNRVKYNNNILNIIANIDLNLRKIMKHEKKEKFLNKKKNKNKKINTHHLPKKKSHGRINCKNINLLRMNN